jgi:hypothetical protein
VFKGYVSRDRRKAYVVEADRAADQLLSRAAAARKLPLHTMLGCLTPLCCMASAVPMTITVSRPFEAQLALRGMAALAGAAQHNT